MDETTISTEYVDEPAVTEPSVFEPTEYFYPEEIFNEVYETEPAATEETVEVIDYTPVIAESTCILANIILCGALMVVGVLCGIRFWR